jgi:hypothetical protein
MKQAKNERSAPSSGLLKRLVHGRTVNVHAHLLSMTWWPTNSVRPEGWEATPGERRYAQEARELFFSENALRFIHQNQTFDAHDGGR